MRGLPLRLGPALCKGDCTWNGNKCEAKASCLGPTCNQKSACLGPSCSLPTSYWPCPIGPGCHPQHPQHPQHPEDPDPEHPQHHHHPKHPEDPENPDDPDPVEGSWSGWSRWGGCSQSCGWGGSRTRTRQCSQPSNGGKPCHGPADEWEACFTKSCLGGSKMSSNFGKICIIFTFLYIMIL